MMNELLKHMRGITLTFPVVNALLYRASNLVLMGGITIDDWTYLARLAMYKINKEGATRT